MIKTTYLNPKTSEDLPDTTSKTMIRKEKKHVTVAYAAVQRSPIRVHDIYLNLCRKEYASVEIVLNTGEIIEGIIDCYDTDTIVLHNEMAQMLIYKHAICYISPRSGKRLILPDKQISYSDQLTFARNTPCTSPSMRQSSLSNGIGS